MIGLRNDHEYGEPHEFKRLRHRDQADERHAVESYDLPDDHERCYWPAEDLRLPGALSHGRVAQEPAAPPPGWNPHDAAGNSAAGGLGGTRPPAARHSTQREAA